MLLKCDAQQLEWRVKVFLSQDKTAIEEIKNNFNLHLENQEKFKLPTRTIAKNWLYRMIFADAFGPNGFGGPAFAYANDVDFMHVSTSIKFWEERVKLFFEKYKGIYEHGVNSIRKAVDEGCIISPSGRRYDFTFEYGDWPRTKILNYPVQGLSADFMVVLRIILFQRLKKLASFGERVLLINTIHDDVEIDVDNDPELVYNICQILEDSFKDIPGEFEKRFGVVVNIPMAGEVKMGWSLYEPEMVEYNPNSFKEDWRKLVS
jgi:hypothetical protein